MVTPATACNSQFAGGFPRLAEIFTGKTRKNSLDNPTSGSHNFSVQTTICTKFISLEIRYLGLSNDMLHDPFWVPEGLQNYLRKSGQKTVGAQIRHVANKIDLQYPRATVTRGASWSCMKSVKFGYITHPPPLKAGSEFLGHFWAVYRQKVRFWGPSLGVFG